MISHPGWVTSGPVDHKMTAALALSHRYLTADQQQLFRWLTLDPGDSFSVHAAAAMAGRLVPSDDGAHIGNTVRLSLDRGARLRALHLP